MMRQTPPLSGPRLLFFSGGSGMKATAQELGSRGADTVHLITPFDSGGSSAALRRAFAMPAVGDLRSRIMALADETLPGLPEIRTLFSYRLPREESPASLMAEFLRLARGNHPLMRQVPEPVNGVLRAHLSWFAPRVPDDFPLAGANVGNLLLAAAYLRNKRRLEPAVALFSSLVRARGLVLPLVETGAHLAVRLASGEVIVGQHRFTGKEVRAVTSPIETLWLTAAEDDAEALSDVRISEETAGLISGADVLCYPVGSFYSSVVANLLPSGVGRAVAACAGRKIFVPNLGNDPELAGHDLPLQVQRLLAPLRADAPDAVVTDFLTHLLLDTSCPYGGVPDKEFRSMGLEVVRARLVPEDKGPLADSRLLADALLDLASYHA